MSSVYESVTNKLIEMMESQKKSFPNEEWQACWNKGFTLPKRACGAYYQGVNVVSLWAESQKKGYTMPTWMTYKQASELGGQVRKGEKASQVIYAASFSKEKENDAGEKEIINGFAHRAYSVFNVEQIDGLDASFYVAPDKKFINPDCRDDSLDAIIAATNAKIGHGGSRAFYQPCGDFIQMPAFEDFRDASSYYSVMFHELTHWTGHESRLNREPSNNNTSFGYAKEELVAELGAAFLCAKLNVSIEPREDHAHYLNCYLAVLKSDSKAIFKAAALASKAADYIALNQ